MRGIYASLAVNVAGGHARAGRDGETRRHLAVAVAAQGDLPADGYDRLVRAEIDALRERLDG